MKHIQSGNLLIRVAEENLVFEVGDAPAGKAEIPPEDLSMLIEFIKAHKDAQTNRRMGFRLDLTQLQPHEFEQLKVTVATGSGEYPVTPSDLSITGIRVQSDQFDADAGLQATLTLAFENKAISLPAVLVRRYDGNRRFAFHFPEIFGDDGRLNPPRELTEILYALESLWLDKNLDLKWNLA